VGILAISDEVQIALTLRLSSPLTVAGPCRIFTGFPNTES
jgi:hypothetical protein